MKRPARGRKAKQQVSGRVMAPGGSVMACRVAALCWLVVTSAESFPELYERLESHEGRAIMERAVAAATMLPEFETSEGRTVAMTLLKELRTKLELFGNAMDYEMPQEACGAPEAAMLPEFESSEGYTVAMTLLKELATKLELFGNAMDYEMPQEACGAPEAARAALEQCSCEVLEILGSAEVKLLQPACLGRYTRAEVYTRRLKHLPEYRVEHCTLCSVKAPALHTLAPAGGLV